MDGISSRANPLILYLLQREKIHLLILPSHRAISYKCLMWFSSHLLKRSTQNILKDITKKVHKILILKQKLATFEKL